MILDESRHANDANDANDANYEATTLQYATRKLPPNPPPISCRVLKPCSGTLQETFRKLLRDENGLTRNSWLHSTADYGIDFGFAYDVTWDEKSKSPAHGRAKRLVGMTGFEPATT
ncbi:MAG: hypothetical protein LRZ88_12615 [Candidatus Cloacimonetes bacterium]|nr:hypothetical protein [Candidatus Cloacimonadota bacterium]